MVSCEICPTEIDLDDDDVEYTYIPVRLGDGSLDDEFYICKSCTEEGEEQARILANEQYEVEQAKYRHPSMLED